MLLKKPSWTTDVVGAVFAAMFLLLLSIMVRSDAITEYFSAPGQASAISGSATCPIALVPHHGSNPIDQRILGIQEKLKSNGIRQQQLERLAWAYVAKARSEFDPGYYSLAEVTANCIDDIEPDSASALLLKAHVYNNMHKFEAAESLARKLVAKRGGWFDFAVFGDALMEQGKLDEAVHAYEKMMDIRPGPQAYLRAAHVRWLTGDLRGAIELARLSIPAVSNQDRESAAWAYVRLADYLYQAGKTEQSEALLQDALLLQTDYPPALLVLGRIYLAEQRFPEAADLLQTAVERNPTPEVQWAFSEALQIVGAELELDLVRARLHRRGPVEDRRTYALYLASTGQFPETAVDLLQQELDVRQDPATLDAMAWALYAAGDYKNAMFYSERAMQHGTRDARMFFHWGAIAAANQKLDSAKRWLNQALVLRRSLLPSEQAQLARELESIRFKQSTAGTKLSQESESGMT